jgi:hypothetical protein
MVRSHYGLIFPVLPVSPVVKKPFAEFLRSAGEHYFLRGIVQKERTSSQETLS